MKTTTLRAVAVALGVSVCTMAQAQSTYSSPAKWNNFRPVSDKGQAAKAAAEAVKKAAPEIELPAPLPTPDPMTMAEPTTSAPIGSAYQQAMAAPCAKARLPLADYFGSANLLFLTLEEGRGHEIVNLPGGPFTTSAVDPEASTGFDISMGRYIDGGRYGLGITYMQWNPSSVSEIRLGAAGTITPTNGGYNNITNGDTGNTVYADVAGFAEGTRLTRDLMFQGIEANLFCFGLMGAQRVSYANCCSGSLLGKYGHHLGLRPGCKGYGGAAGPLARGCGGRVRVMTSHGFRWLQVEDELELAYNIDTVAGYQADDLYENVDIENNLYGYQFGARLTYCINSRMNLNIGGKFGIYGNHAEMRHRVGTQTITAYRNGVATDLIDTESSDTVLATLGELDLGLGYRLGCAWTIRGGYRLMGITGVANAADSVPTNYSSVAASGQVYADDSYVLHGGYVGLEYNW